jgi:hypothetical protein
MKKIALLLALAAIYGSAQANSLSISGLSAEFSVSGYNGSPAAVTGTKTAGNFGTLVTNGKGTFTATYLGNESSFSDGYRFTLGNSSELNESNAIGDSISRSVTGGTVNFQFFDNHSGITNDGGPSTPYATFAILKDVSGSPFAESNGYGTFQYLLGFNDNYRGDGDYDDYVVGVNYTPAVPLPAALPLMASALGIMGLGMRRRQV